MAAEPNPWMTTTPLRRSSFVPLHDAHAEFAVETAMDGWGDVLPDPLYSDYQTNPEMCVLGRLGSGRAGLYRGRYLKGVGRTRLAANWASPADVFHHSGHQATSGATREYLVSVYMRAKGYAHLINPCEGILVKPAAPILRDYLLPQLSPELAANPPQYFNSDLALQAITLKPEGVTRFSNFVWLSLNLDLLGGGFGTDEFLQLWVQQLGGAPESWRDPRVAAALFFDNLEAALVNLHLFWKSGVLWGSLHNNFSVDGRYVDLEGPALVGRPVAGLVLAGPHDEIQLPHSQMISGVLEAYGFGLYSQMLTWFFKTRFAAIAELPGTRSAGLAAAFSESLASEEAARKLFEREQLSARLHGWIAEEIPLTKRVSVELTEVLERTYRLHFSGIQESQSLALLPVESLAAGPFSEPATLHQFDFLPKVEVPASEEAGLVNRWIRKLDEEEEPDSFLSGVREAEREISQSILPAESPSAV